MISDEHIEFLQQQGWRYLVGTPKSALREFEQELLSEDWETVREGLEVKKCPSPDGRETFILCRSTDRREAGEWRAWSELSEGCYLLRSNVEDWNAEDLWRAYIQLTEAEAAFRIHKSDLRLRPVWHQKPERVQAHILVCFLAYVLWKTLAQLCRQAGLGDEPRKVLDEIQGIALVNRGCAEFRNCLLWCSSCVAMY